MINRQKTNPEDVKKLPKWAQREIGVLENEIERLKKQVAQIEGKEDSNVKLVEGIETKNLPKDSWVGFFLSSGYVEVHIRNGELEITSYGGKETMHVIPSNNSIHVIIVKDG